MKIREEIYEELFTPNEVKRRGFTETKIIIDLLLDIRDLLNKDNENNKS